MYSALQPTHQLQSGPSKAIGVGLGWLIDKRNNLIWHNGSTHGYSCFMGFHPDQSVGVVILSNYRPDFADDSLDQIGFEILKQYR